jgi:hypothetical protein
VETLEKEMHDQERAKKARKDNEKESEHDEEDD